MTKLYIIIIAMLLAACSVNDNSSCIIKGKVIGESKGKLFLWKVVDKKQRNYQKVDSVTLASNEFQFDLGKIDENLYCLSIDRNKRFLFLDNSEINVEFNTKRTGRDLIAIATGSSLHDEYFDFVNTIDSIMNNSPVRDSLLIEQTKAKANNETEKLIVIKNQFSQLYYKNYDRQVAYVTNYVEGNVNSVMGLFVSKEHYLYQHNYDQKESILKFEALLDKCNVKLRESSYYKSLLAALDGYKKCSLGSVAPPIIGSDKSNNEVKLSDFAGKFVLVDFWASHCSWCRKETPNILEANNIFKNKGLVVLGVSSDRKRKSWLKAIDEDKSYWDQIIMSKEQYGSVFKDYRINGIPEIMLISPEGTILAKGLRGENILKTIATHIK